MAAGMGETFLAIASLCRSVRLAAGLPHYVPFAVTSGRSASFVSIKPRRSPTTLTLASSSGASRTRNSCSDPHHQPNDINGIEAQRLAQVLIVL